MPPRTSSSSTTSLLLLHSSLNPPITTRSSIYLTSAFISIPHPVHQQVHLQQQIRHATLIRRPLRPYTFTQLLTLSDGSVTTVRTTSPLPVYKSFKDTRNHALWNPSSKSLANLEEDEAGRLRAFRKRFGRGWDAEAASTTSASLPLTEEGEVDVDGEPAEGGKEVMEGQSGRPTVGKEAGSKMGRQEDDADDGGLWDLISGFETSAGGVGGGVGSAKGKGGKKGQGQQKKGMKGAGETVRGKK